MSSTLNEQLVSIRTRHNMSQAEVSAEVGADLRTYQRWEKGAMPQPHYRKKLCEVFHMTAEELGFGMKRLTPSTLSPLITPRSQTPMAFTQERSVPESVLAIPGPERLTVDMVSIGIRALAIAQQHYGITTEELLSEVERELRRLDTMQQNSEQKISRRAVLAFLAELPIAAMSLTKTEQPQTLFTEEILPMYVTSIPSCWRLFYEGDWQEVERLLPTYIAQLSPLAHQTTTYQQTAASLLSQAHQLAAEIVLQREDFGSSLAHCNQAFSYGQLAKDPNLQAGALIRKGNTLFYRNKSSLSTYQEAMQHITDVSPLLKGRIYSEYSCSLRKKMGTKRDVDRYMELAHESTPEFPEQDPYFPYSHSDHYILHFNDMLTYLWFEQPKLAWKAITTANTFVPKVINARRLELEKHLVLVSIALGDMEQTIAHFELLASSVSVLQSDLHNNELQETFEQMQKRWPLEQRVKDMRGLIE